MNIFPDPTHEAGVLPASGREPTDAELQAIEREMPLIQAEIALLDVEVSLIDRPLTGVDVKRLRRAERRVLDEILRWLTNRAAAGSEAA
ncbi:DUF6284 family protein [Streptomyces sp. NRRL B-1677]|uniref:DUF6284 family protein n=1 Tax=Streptomyces sp. NRRL B-1677 TaxID=2682966 RepID=UPI003A7F40D0